MALLKSSYILLFAALLCTKISYKKIDEFYQNTKKQNVNEVLYLPNGEALNFISFGYKNVLSHTLWFNLINYFGKHFKGDRDYRWLGHMCNLVADLNPKSEHVYEFCSLMLAWEANLPDESIALLNKGVKEFPAYWKFPYLRGITKLIILKDTQNSKDDFILSAKLPGAHPIVIRIAAKNISLSESHDDAIEFLEEMIRNSTQESERGALASKLEEIKLQKAKSESMELAQ